MIVELMNYTPNPEDAIIKAIRTCYQSFAKQNETSDAKLLAHIVKNEESPLEFANFTFHIKGVSRACSHQIVRHRIASYAQKSQRYVDETQFDYVIPPSIKHDSVALTLYLQVMDAIQEYYKKLQEMGIKKEDARFVLPNACCTDLVVDFNARSLRHFIRLRSAPKAQWEIRNLALIMKSLVKPVAPALMKGLIV